MFFWVTCKVLGAFGAIEESGFHSLALKGLVKVPGVKPDRFFKGLGLATGFGFGDSRLESV